MWAKMVTENVYNEMLKKQYNKCAICKKPQPKYSIYKWSEKRLSIDHNHSTGRIRGLLCSKCNLAIGLLKEDVKTLKRAIRYLEKWQETA